MKSRYWKFGIGMGLLFIGMVLLTGFGVMLLWNYLMPAIFGLPEIFFGQALGLLVLSRMLVGGFGGGKWRGGHGCGSGNWKQRWNHLSPDEREQLKKKYYNFCNYKYKYGYEYNYGEAEKKNEAADEEKKG